MKNAHKAKRLLAASAAFLMISACGPADESAEDNKNKQDQVKQAQPQQTQEQQTQEQQSTDQTLSPAPLAKSLVPNQDTPSSVKKDQIMHLTGQVVYKTFEGGFFAIDGDDGKHYLPLNLPEHARKAGIKVAMDVIIKSGVMTIYNYGIPIEIQDLTITDDSADEGTVM